MDPRGGHVGYNTLTCGLHDIGFLKYPYTSAHVSVIEIEPADERASAGCESRLAFARFNHPMRPVSTGKKSRLFRLQDKKHNT